MRGADNKTATTAARIFSRLDSVEEVQRSRSGSAVGIAAQPGSAGGGGGAVAGTGAAVAVAAQSSSAAGAGSPARAGQHQQQKAAAQYGSVGVGVGVGNAAGVVRNRSASTILDLGHSSAGQSALSRKFSTAAAAAAAAAQAGTAGDVNGYGDAAAKCDTYNGLAGAGAGAGAGGVGLGTGRIAAAAPVATASSLGISLRERLSISGASGGGGAAAASDTTTTLAGGSAPTIGSSSSSIASPSVPHCKRQGSFSNVFSKLIDGMPASTMFAKFKSSANVAASTSSQNVAEGNPITQYFEIGKPVACAGPELCWRIHDGYRKSDNKVSEMHTPCPSLSLSLSTFFSIFLSPSLTPPGMLCVYIREETGRETAQATPQGDHYGAAEGLGEDIGTLSSSPGECLSLSLSLSVCVAQIFIYIATMFFGGK